MSGDMSYIWLDGVVDGKATSNSGLRGYMYGGVSYRFEDGWRINGITASVLPKTWLKRN